MLARYLAHHRSRPVRYAVDPSQAAGLWGAGLLTAAGFPALMRQLEQPGAAGVSHIPDSDIGPEWDDFMRGNFGLSGLHRVLSEYLRDPVHDYPNHPLLVQMMEHLQRHGGLNPALHPAFSEGPVASDADHAALQAFYGSVPRRGLMQLRNIMRNYTTDAQAHEDAGLWLPGTVLQDAGGRGRHFEDILARGVLHRGDLSSLAYMSDVLERAAPGGDIGTEFLDIPGLPQSVHSALVANMIRRLQSAPGAE